MIAYIPHPLRQCDIDNSSTHAKDIVWLWRRGHKRRHSLSSFSWDTHLRSTDTTRQPVCWNLWATRKLPTNPGRDPRESPWDGMKEKIALATLSHYGPNHPLVMTMRKTEAQTTQPSCPCSRRTAPREGKHLHFKMTHNTVACMGHHSPLPSF